jgi:hypothetical protein
VKNHRGIKIGIFLTVAISLAIVLLVPTPVIYGQMRNLEANGLTLNTQQLALIPQEVKQDAARVADELLGSQAEKAEDYASQLLASYYAAKNKDFVIIFNPGGWGWASIKDSSGWDSIAVAISAELSDMGYDTLILDYQRSTSDLIGPLSEMTDSVSKYADKAKYLASRVDFLTRHLPDISIILTGESNGTIICDKVMRLLEKNQQVYSIQTGPPSWHTTFDIERSLVLRSNGQVPDSFSQGHFLTAIRANLEALFGIDQQNEGDILLYIGAPGHDYGWQYPELRNRILDFLHTNFG